MTLRIIQVCPRFPAHGGVERHVLKLSMALRDRGVEVIVLACQSHSQDPKHEYFENMEVFRFRCWSPSDSYYFSPSIFGYLARTKSLRTVVHSHSYQALPAFEAALAKPLNDLPIVFTPHYHPFGGTKIRTVLKSFYRPFGEILFGASDLVVALSNHERSILQATFGIEASKIHIIPSGISRGKPIARTPSANIVYAGRLERYKGVGFLIESMPMVLEHLPTATLSIVGTGSDETRLRRIAERKGVSAAVMFLGTVSQKRLEELLAGAGVVAVVSEYEAYSLIIGEALQMGVPVLASRVGAIPEIHGDDPNCALIDYPPSSEELAQKITEILLGERARPSPVADSEVERLSWADVADVFIDAYETLLSRPR